jgi:hypothetical protein
MCRDRGAGLEGGGGAGLGQDRGAGIGATRRSAAAEHAAQAFLNNERYIGRLVWNRPRRLKGAQPGRRGRDWNPRGLDADARPRDADQRRRALTARKTAPGPDRGRSARDGDQGDQGPGPAPRPTPADGSDLRRGLRRPVRRCRARPRRRNTRACRRPVRRPRSQEQSVCSLFASGEPKFRPGEDAKRFGKTPSATLAAPETGHLGNARLGRRAHRPSEPAAATRCHPRRGHRADRGSLTLWAIAGPH